MTIHRDDGAPGHFADVPPDARDATDRPIRLAFCITELDVGGAERCLVELATRLDRREFSPVIYSLGAWPSAERGALVAQLEAGAVPTFFLNAHSARDVPRTLPRLARMLRQQRPHVTQTFLVHANLIGAAAARLAGLGPIFTGIRVAERQRPWRLAAQRWLDRWVAAHVCVSEAVAEFSADQGGLPRRKLRVIPNGVDPARFRDLAAATNSSLGVPAGRRLIACIARLDRQKGVDRLLAAAPEFLAALPEHDLVIVGQGPERERLAAQARQSGLGERIRFLGWRADAMGILAAADVVASLARWEGMSNVLLEAMAAGKPVVTTAVEGVRELLGGENPIQVVSAECLAEAPGRIVEICRNHKLVKELGDANRRRAELDFSLDAMVRRYAQLYREHVRSARGER